jgi:general secretion pathway protein L
VAAAKLMVAELVAEPIGALHVALGDRGEDGSTCVALVSTALVSGWLAALARAGLDARLIVPETALLAAPGDELVRYDRDGIAFCRGPAEAFALESRLADLVLGSRPVQRLSDRDWADGVSGALSRPLVNIRQGMFARQHVRVEEAFVRRAALLFLAILFVTVATDLVAAYRDSAAAGRMEEEARTIAVASLPRGRGIVDPPTQLKGRLSELGGGQGSFAAEASVLVAAVRDTPGASLASLAYRAGGLSTAIRADSAATLAQLRGRLEAEGYSVAGPAPRPDAAGQTVQWLVRPQ